MREELVSESRLRNTTGIGSWGVIALSSLWAFIGACAEGPDRSAVTGDRPNIVLVIGDDQGYPDFGFMGSPLARTPNLDGLAAGGTLFRFGYTTASACRPALFSLLTGLDPLEFEARAGFDPVNFLIPSRDGRRPFQLSRAPLAGIATLPRLLAEHGYASLQAGKYWEGHYAIAGFSDGMTTTMMKQGTRLVRETTESVYAFPRAHSETPFFLWFAPTIPHVPHDAPRRFFDLYDGVEVPAGRHGYYASVSWLDASVGELVRHLEEHGLRERTLVAYVTDNGWRATGYDPSHGRSGFSRDGGRGKFSLYEMGFRNPIILNWPWRVSAGKVSDALVSTVDL